MSDQNMSNANISSQGVNTDPTQVDTPQRVNHEVGVERTRPGRLYTPPADIYEDDQSVYVVADMPGVEPGAVDIDIQENVLTIYAKREPQPVPEGYRRLHSEFEEGDFRRRFALSDHIDQDRIEAKMDAGVLRLTLPKAQPTQKKIEVRSA
jgi:HSP20 family molecular chaperone IbpA